MYFFLGLSNVSNEISKMFHFHFCREDLVSILNDVYDKMASQAEGR